MTEQEITIARALRAVKLPTASKTHLIVLSLALQTRTHPDKDLTPSQRRALLNIAHQYRAQLPADVVELALKLRAEAER